MLDIDDTLRRCLLLMLRCRGKWKCVDLSPSFSQNKFLCRLVSSRTFSGLHQVDNALGGSIGRNVSLGGRGGALVEQGGIFLRERKSHCQRELIVVFVGGFSPLPSQMTTSDTDPCSQTDEYPRRGPHRQGPLTRTPPSQTRTPLSQTRTPPSQTNLILYLIILVVHSCT